MAKPVSKELRAQAGGGQPSGAPDRDASGDDGVDLGQLWSTLRESKRFILTFALLLFCAVVAHTMMSRMTFRSTGRLYLGELESKRGNSGELDISGGGQGDVGSEIEILKSQSLVTRGILDAGLNVAITPVGWQAPRFWRWLASERDMRELDLAPKQIAAVNTSLVDNSRGPRRYRVEFVDAEWYEVRDAQQRVVGKGRLGEALGLPDMHLTLVPGTKGSPAPGARYDVTVNPLDAMTDAVLGALNVTAPKSVGSESAKVVSLEFTDRSPYFAATFLRKLMRGYLDERQAWKTEDASAAETFVTDQLRGLRDSLDKSEQKLAEYRSNTRGVVLDNEAKVMIEQVGKYEEQRVAARLQVAALSEVKRALKLPNPPTEAFLLGEANDTVLEGLSHALAEARTVYEDAQEQFGASSVQAQKQHAQVDVQLQMIRNYVSSRLARAEENLRELNSIIGQFEQKLRTVPGAELGLAQLGRESEVYSRVYSYLLERQQQAAITKASTVSKNRILDFPQEPYREDTPKLLLRLLSAPLALLLGAVLVLVHRMFASTLQSASEVRRAAYGVPVYASIPRRPRIKGRTKTLSDAHSIDVLARAPNSPFAEAFRTLRTNLYHWGPAEQGRVTLFTSPTPGDGKTTCVLSLAGILTADKKRVLVVDADLRKPSHHDLTDQGQGPGLRGILSGQCHWIDVVHPVRLSVGTYDSISAGKMAPAELLSSERMSRFVNDAKQHYDFILLDSPSFPLVSDALVLSDVADCVMSVFRLRNTPRKLAAEHVRGLSSAAEVYGAIINDAHTVGTAYPGSTRAVRVSFDRPSEPPSYDQTGASGGGKVAKLVAVVAVLAAVAVGAALAFQGGDARQLVRARMAAFGAGDAHAVVPTPPALPARQAALPAAPAAADALPAPPAPIAPQSADPAPPPAPAPAPHAVAAPPSDLKKPAPKAVAPAPKAWLAKPAGAAQPKPWQQAANRPRAPQGTQGKVAPATRTWVPRAKVAAPSMDTEVPPVLSVRPAASAQGEVQSVPAAPVGAEAAPAPSGSRGADAPTPAQADAPSPSATSGAAPTPNGAGPAPEQAQGPAAAPALPTPPPPASVTPPTPPPSEPGPAAPAAPASDPAAPTSPAASRGAQVMPSSAASAGAHVMPTPSAPPVAQTKAGSAAPASAPPQAVRPAGASQSKVQPAAPAR